MGLVAEVLGVFAVKSEMGVSPLVAIRSEDGRVLPVYIGLPEAMAINIAVEGESMPRPMTHDLLVEIFSRLSAKIESVVIDDLVDNTFYARIIARKNDDEIEIDARPSDSIALAVRAVCPIYVNAKVLDEAGKEELPENCIGFNELV